MSRGRALGMIETFGLVFILQAADAMVKAGEVDLVGYENTASGYISVLVQGDVAACKSAVEAGVKSVEDMGAEVYSSCVIATPHPDIDKIVETYERREDVDKYAHVATMQEIEENGFNLNIPRYVDTFEPEEEIDLNEVAAEIRKLQSEIKSIDAELKPFFDELGLDFPFDVEGK